MLLTCPLEVLAPLKWSLLLRRVLRECAGLCEGVDVGLGYRVVLSPPHYLLSLPHYLLTTNPVANAGAWSPDPLSLPLCLVAHSVF